MKMLSEYNTKQTILIMYINFRLKKSSIAIKFPKIVVIQDESHFRTPTIIHHDQMINKEIRKVK